MNPVKRLGLSAVALCGLLLGASVFVPFPGHAQGGSSPVALLVQERETRSAVTRSPWVQLDESNAEFIRVSADVADSDLTNTTKSAQFNIYKSTDNGVTQIPIGGFGFQGSTSPAIDQDTGSAQPYQEIPVAQIGSGLIQIEIVLPSGKTLLTGAVIQTL